MSEGCKGQKRGVKRKSVALKSPSHLRNWNSIVDLSGMTAWEWLKKKKSLYLKLLAMKEHNTKSGIDYNILEHIVHEILPKTCTWTYFHSD